MARQPARRGFGGAVSGREATQRAGTALAGFIVEQQAQGPGAVIEGIRTLEDMGRPIRFGNRLLNPFDLILSPPGQSAWDQILQTDDAIENYIGRRIRHPGLVANDIGAGLHRFRLATDPSASPAARTFPAEMMRRGTIGLNQGGAFLDIWSGLNGGLELRTMGAIPRLTREAAEAKYLARGYPAPIARYFSEPYTGMGSHYIPQRTPLPKFLGGGPRPKAILDSPLFLLKPEGVTKGEMFERHFKVDRFYNGGPAKRKYGITRWSGKELGWEKYGLLGKVVYGAPPALKATVGGVLGAGAGTVRAVAHSAKQGETR